MKLKIAGYKRETHCDHCGRALLHGIILADGRVVGATCLTRKMTKPHVYMGRTWRTRETDAVRYAKLAELGKLGQAGIPEEAITFESVD